jgi:MtrB/PioB family decaheme-associated outer membrane protein
MGARGLTRAIVLSGVVLGLAGPAWAQIDFGDFKLAGEVEVGGAYLAEPSTSRRAKFEEYRDVPEFAFLEGLRLRLYDPSERYSFELWGTNWGYEDQEYLALLERVGLWQAGFEWNQIPHILSTTGRSLAVETSPDTFTLPTPRPSPLSLHNLAPRLDEIGVRWDTARLWLLVTPTPELDLRAEYTRIQKDGTRPFSAAFGSPGGNFFEVLQPIDQTVHDFRLTGTWAGERYQIQAGYTLSIFNNDFDSVTIDNPCFGLPAALPAGCGASDGGAAAPARGRVSLAPDNMAHSVFVSGGASLPWWRTRLTGNFSWGLQLQNADFLAHTITPALASNPLLALPESSLDGHVQTILLNLSAVSRPLPPLALTLKYRLFDYDDRTDTLTFPGHVVNDRGPVATDEREAGRFSYTRHNVDGDARWRFSWPVSLTGGGGWERWDRNRHREVQRSDEYFAKGVVDATPLDWLNLRLLYRPSFRRIGEYDTFAHAGHEVQEDPEGAGARQFQSVLLRKFDEADRNRQRVDFEVSITPIPSVTLTTTVGYRDDDYFNSTLGLQQSTVWAVGADVTWRPTDRFSAFAGYMWERYDSRQRSRSRPVTGATTFDFPDFDWVSDSIDTINTVHAGIQAALIPDALDLRIVASFEQAVGEIDTFNPITPVSGTAAQRASAIAQPFPRFKDHLFRLESALRYRFLKNWSATLRHVFETYDQKDWRTDGLDPFQGLSSIWLGNDLRAYHAHWVGIVLGYRFR